jgi:ribosomal protein S18 acetylase RimI-like enzyme
MEFREATSDDGDAVREIAERSLEASYSLSPGTIQNAVRQWYGADELEAKLDQDGGLLLVCEFEGEVVAFTESALIENDDRTVADLLWLHVHPDYRGQGIGDELFEATRDRLRDRGAADLRGRVLSINEAGNTFYKKRGFERAGEGEIEIDGRTHTEVLYVEAEPTGLQPVTGEAGTTVYVDRDDVERGSIGGFHTVYVDEDRDELYGYYCGKCDTLANAMDAMGRIECDNCGNSRKPTRWDAAYM